MDRPALEYVAELHHVGRQLAVLKRMYQSYEIIIERVLERKRATDPRSALSTRTTSGNPVTHGKTDRGHASHQPAAPLDNATEEVSGLRAALSPAAIVRFERLKDRISLYALNEIQDCLDEKESLTIMVSPKTDSRSLSLLRRYLELQPHRNQRVTIRRTLNADYYFACQGHYFVPSRKSDDCILLSPDQ